MPLIIGYELLFMVLMVVLNSVDKVPDTIPEGKEVLPEGKEVGNYQTPLFATGLD